MQRLILATALLFSLSFASASDNTNLVSELFSDVGIVQLSKCDHPILTSPGIRQGADVVCGRTELSFENFKKLWDAYATLNMTYGEVKSLTPWQEESSVEWSKVMSLNRYRLLVHYVQKANGGTVTIASARKAAQDDEVTLKTPKLADPPGFSADVKATTIKFLESNGYKLVTCQNGTHQVFGRTWTICFKPPAGLSHFKTVWPRIKPIVSQHGTASTIMDWINDGVNASSLAMSVGDNHLFFAAYVPASKKVSAPFVQVSLAPWPED